MNHPKSFKLIVGLPFLSSSSYVDIFESTNGLKKAMKSVAEECIPSVPEYASTMRPVKNPRISRNQPGISNGKSIMNKM